MKETLQTPAALADEVARLREQVLDLGEQVVTLTAEVLALRAAPDTREAQRNRALEAALSGAPGAPEAGALVNGSATGGRAGSHLRVLPGGAR
jgi:hypothetical protein